jgi:hypothetical protein
MVARTEVETSVGIDSAYGELAKAIPSFAGITFQDGRFVVAITKQSDSLSAAPLVRAALTNRVRYAPFARSRLPNPIVSYRSVTRTWGALVAARDAILRDAKLADVHSVDIDEAVNAVVLYVATTDEAEVVTREISGMRSFTSGEVLVRVTERAKPDQGTGLTLASRYRPIIGGVQIFPGCTATIVAKSGGEWLLFTNSHCTSFKYWPDGGQTTQPWSGAAGAPPGIVSWGLERDRTPYGCLIAYKCRRADVAAYTFANLDYDTSTEIPSLPGVIARPPQRVAGSAMAAGPVDEYFITSGDEIPVEGNLQVAATKLWAVVGEELERVGWRTGWRYGTVVRTCFDSWVAGQYGNVRLRCSDEGTIFSEPGDSGSPMFQRLDPSNGLNQVVFLGINWGSRETDASNFYHTLDSMQKDFPALCFWYGC